MRHLNVGNQLSRSSSHRTALLKNLLTSLLRYGRIKTTTAKAKELRRYAEHFVTLGKQGTLAARRQAFEWIRDREVLTKLFADYAVRFSDRNGGYTRITHMEPRYGDNAAMSMIEYLPGKNTTPATTATDKSAKAKKVAKPAKVAKAAKAEKKPATAKKAKTTGSKKTAKGKE